MQLRPVYGWSAGTRYRIVLEREGVTVRAPRAIIAFVGPIAPGSSKPPAIEAGRCDSGPGLCRFTQCE